jgi:exonuclease SbcD
VGSLAHVGADCFPACLDYLALGHLHSAQKVNGSEFMRYSGAPLKMSCAEAERDKSVTLTDLDSDEAKKRVTLIPVPVFQPMERIRGDMDALEARLKELILRGDAIWLEIVYEGVELIPDLQERLNAVVAGSKLEILRIKNARALSAFFDPSDAGEVLGEPDELDVTEVFVRCLELHSIPDSQRPELLSAYRELLALMDSKDPGAE